MSNYFEQLEAQLEAAARAQSSARQRTTRAAFGWTKSGTRALPLLLTVGLIVAVAAVVLTLGSAHRAPAAAPNQGRELAYIRAAARRARHSKACANRERALPTFTDASPPPALLSALAVLRRPATGADKLPASLRGSSSGFYAAIYVNGVRRARVTHGISYYLVPVRYLSPLPRPLSTGCYQAIVRALQAEAPNIPPRLRAPTLSLLARRIARQRRRLRQTPDPGVCLMYSGGAGEGGFCGPARQIEQTGLINCCGLLVGIVPDGVAAVTFHYPASNGAAAQTVTARVAGNVFFATLHVHAPELPSPAMIWRSAQGKTIKTIPASTRSQATANGWCAGDKPGGLCGDVGGASPQLSR